jgi:hypothetical protein
VSADFAEDRRVELLCERGPAHQRRANRLEQGRDAYAEDQAEDRAEREVRWAIIASLIVNVGGLAAFALPGQDKVPAGAKIGAVVFAIIALVGIAGLWQHRRWGAWITIGVTAINVLSSLGALFDPPSAALVVAVVVSIPIGVAAVVLVRRPEVRATLR